MVIKIFENMINNYKVNSLKKQEKRRYEIELAKIQAKMDYDNKIKAMELKNKQENCNHNYKLINERVVRKSGVTYFMTVETIRYKLFSLKCLKCNKKVIDCSEEYKNTLLKESELNKYSY